MSKLIDKLNQVARAVSQPIGFRMAQPASSRAWLILLASTTQTTDASGADAVLIGKLSAGAKALPGIARSFSDIPWGLLPGNIDRKEMKAAVEAGCDFLVLSTDTPLALPEGEKTGKILRVEASLSEGLLRTVNELPVDAVLIAGEPAEESPLTWHHLMLFQRLADLLIKPLLVPVPLSITASELQALWEAGVAGVMVEAGDGQSAGKLKELRRIIDNLTFQPRQRRKAEALIPRIGGGTGPATEEEEEEDF